MNNFLHLASGVDVMPLLLALKHKPDLWNQITVRTNHPMTAHSQVNDILLRFNPLSADVVSIIDGHESVNYPAFYELPEARELIFQLMARVQGERLGRCLITSLRPGAAIDPHVDGGDHAAYYERYHIVLQSNPKSLFRCGDETVNMQAGEVWWFDNQVEHEVINNGPDDRIHLIVDIKACK